MSKLIDADKLLEAMKSRVNELLRDPNQTYDVHPVVNALCNYIDRIESGTFDPTPPVQPDTPKPGDKVWHKEKRMKYLGIGNVLEIAASGKTARVEWPNYDKTKCNWPPYPAYYRLDKLEVIK